MRDLDKALLDISDIRAQLAAGTLFRGLGPAVIAATGLLALGLALLQQLWPQYFAATPLQLVGNWIGIAVIAGLLISVEMIARSRRHHAGMATAMILRAVEHFLPAGAAGAAIAAVFIKLAPAALWTLPGLWQLLTAVGLFAALGNLPAAVRFAAAWYFVAGVAALALGAGDDTLSPWLMGAPYGLGQLLLAAILHKAEEAHDD
jgi:hypothetical protein